ncbi:MAG: hypothetical protein ABI534_01735 [Chloroflexota bacterium]
MSRVLHRIPIGRGATPTVVLGDEITPDGRVATRRRPGSARSVPIAGPLHATPAHAAGMLLHAPGTVLEAGDALARSPRGREVLAPVAGLLLAYSLSDGTATLAPLGEEEEVVAHLRGRVERIEETALSVGVTGARIVGVGGTGEAVHGPLVMGVRDPADELRASAIDVGATGRIVVGGSRASAETLTRARAMGVAGIVLGGVLDKELRDFIAIQRRRRELGGIGGTFGVLLVEGFGKVGLDPLVHAWFVEHEGHEASLFGDQHLLYVYDADRPPLRRALPRVGDRVVIHRRPFQGQGGVLLEILDRPHVVPSGIATRVGLVRFADGRVAPVPLANVEAVTVDSPENDAGD